MYNQQRRLDPRMPPLPAQYWQGSHAQPGSSAWQDPPTYPTSFVTSSAIAPGIQIQPTTQRWGNTQAPISFSTSAFAPLSSTSTLNTMSNGSLQAKEDTTSPTSPNRKKNLVDMIQEDFPRTPSPVYALEKLRAAQQQRHGNEAGAEGEAEEPTGAAATSGGAAPPAGYDSPRTSRPTTSSRYTSGTPLTLEMSQRRSQTPTLRASSRSRADTMPNRPGELFDPSPLPNSAYAPRSATPAMTASRFDDLDPTADDQGHLLAGMRAMRVSDQHDGEHRLSSRTSFGSNRIERVSSPQSALHYSRSNMGSPGFGQSNSIFGPFRFLVLTTGYS